jgi:hypothetical protein
VGDCPVGKAYRASWFTPSLPLSLPRAFASPAGAFHQAAGRSCGGVRSKHGKHYFIFTGFVFTFKIQTPFDQAD